MNDDLQNNVPTINISQLQRCIALGWKAGIPIIAIGGVGTGKTTAFKDFVTGLNEDTEESPFKFWCRNLALEQVEDESGIPYPGNDGETVRYLMPEDMPWNCDDKGVILGDELDRCSPELQNAFLTILLGRKIHGHELSPNAYVAGAMNGTTDIYTTPLSKAARTRVCSLFVSAHAEGSVDSYDDWATANGIHPVIRGFRRFRGSLVNNDDNQLEELAIDTDRTRDMAGRLFSVLGSVNFPTEDILFPMVAGLIGRGSAIELLAYRKLMDKAPDPAKVLQDPENAPVPMDAVDILPALCAAIVDLVPKGDRKQATKAMIYAARLPTEVGAYLVRKLAQPEKVPQLVSTKEYQAWASKHMNILA